jgi:dimethylhistidine N-methyltransferase
MPTAAVKARDAFAATVREGLTKTGQKELPSILLYDDLGSALFEAITYLPEYGLTRADERILRRHATDILEHLDLPVLVAELGSGSGRKTRWLLEALSRLQPVMYYPIEISKSALARCRMELGLIGSISIVGMERSYVEGLREVASRREPGQTLLVLFLGSTIGNFDRPAAVEFLARIHDCLRPGDALLLGCDLMKPVEDLLLAYADPIGLTAAFNRNLLGHVNRRLGADFVADNFEHEARYNEAERRIEMHLRSKCWQTVRIPGLNVDCTLEAGETIWTESCHKFTPEEVAGMAARAGFTCAAQWADAEWPFAESLLLATGAPEPA